MKPVEEAVKSTTPFINSTFSSKQTVELFSGKKQTSFATGDDNADNLGHVIFFVLWAKLNLFIKKFK